MHVADGRRPAEKINRVARNVQQILALALLSAMAVPVAKTTSALAMDTYNNKDFFPLVLYYKSGNSRVGSLVRHACEGKSGKKWGERICRSL